MGLPIDDDYEADVERGRRLVATNHETKWELGDLALKRAPIGESGAHNDSTEILEKFAADIGIETVTLRNYRWVAASWPPATQVAGASWTVHRVLASRPEHEALLNGLVRDAGDGNVTSAAAQSAIEQARSDDGLDPEAVKAAKIVGLSVSAGVGWHMAALVVSRVGASETGKVSIAAFAKEAEMSIDEIREYFDAWQLAAKAGLVPFAEGVTRGTDLSPGALLRMNLPDWGDFYTGYATWTRGAKYEDVAS